jgi:hypothetical protein
MPFNAYNIAVLEIEYVRPDIDDLSDEFMTDGRRYFNGAL